jgi:hypothetical protein
MNVGVILPMVAAILAGLFTVLLLDQWLRRRRTYQLVWAIGVAWFGIAALAEVLGSLAGWDSFLYRMWYLGGAILVAAWLGLGTVLLLAKTRFGYAFALTVLLAGLFAGLLPFFGRRYPDAGVAPIVYFVVAAALALYVVWDTYLGGSTWPSVVAGALVVGSLASLVLIFVAPVPGAGFLIDPRTGVPDPSILPGYVRLLTPFFNITGAFSLVFGAIFSTWVFMPKRRILAYSLEPDQKADELAFNLAISLVAFPVNFVASLPGLVRAFLAGRLHSRVPATILIALGGIVASLGTGLARFGEVRAFDISLVAGLALLFAGFLVSAETFRDVRIPFTERLIWHRADQ